MYISNRLYTKNLSEQDKQNLTLYVDDATVKLYTQFDDGTYAIPRYYNMEWYNKADKQFTLGEDIDFNTTIELRDDIQKEAVKAIVESDHGGIVALSTGIGKTVISIYSISQIKKRALIIVPNNLLFNQWIEAINKFSTSENNIGIIKGKKFETDKEIYITTVQTLARRCDNEDFLNKMKELNIGIAFFDEAHTSQTASKFQEASKCVFAKKIISLTATPYRSSDLVKLFDWNCGSIICNNTNFKIPIVVNFIDIPVEVTKGQHWRMTTFGNGKGFNVNYAKLLLKDEKYLTSIGKLIDINLENNRKIIVLASLIDMLYAIYDHVENKDRCSVVHASTEKDYEKDCIIGSTSLLKAGADIPDRDCIIFGTSISNKAGLIQALGRCARYYPGKKNIIAYDITNTKYGELNSYLQNRIKIYKEQKLKLLKISNMNQIPQMINQINEKTGGNN